MIMKRSSRFLTNGKWHHKVDSVSHAAVTNHILNPIVLMYA